MTHFATTTLKDSQPGLGLSFSGGPQIAREDSAPLLSHTATLVHIVPVPLSRRDAILLHTHIYTQPPHSPSWFSPRGTGEGEGAAGRKLTAPLSVPRPHFQAAPIQSMPPRSNLGLDGEPQARVLPKGQVYHLLRRPRCGCPAGSLPASEASRGL